MTLWKAILQAVECCPVGHEFGLMFGGFRQMDEYGQSCEVGLVERVCEMLGKRVSDGNISRRMREFNAGDYDGRAGRIFRYEVVDHCWYRIVENRVIDGGRKEGEGQQRNREFRVTVNQRGEFCLF